MVGELADLRRRPPWDGQSIEQPVLAMLGERSRPHHRQAMEQFPAMVCNGKLEIITGAGHFGPNTNADQVSTSIVRFLRATSTSDG